MSNKRYNYKDIPPECLLEIFNGINKELKEQPVGKRSFKKALLSWKDAGGLKRVHRKYSQFYSGKKTEVAWDGKTMLMIPYRRINEIYNQILKEYGSVLGGPKVYPWNKSEKEFKAHNEKILKKLKTK